MAKLHPMSDDARLALHFALDGIAGLAGEPVINGSTRWDLTHGMYVSDYGREVWPSPAPAYGLFIEETDGPRGPDNMLVRFEDAFTMAAVAARLLVEARALPCDGWRAELLARAEARLALLREQLRDVETVAAEHEARPVGTPA